MSEKPGFQTLSDIRGLLAAAGLRPKKRFGQCFLIDRNLMHKLIDSAGIGPADCILEVGGGTGSLTCMLAGRAGRVVSVELDEGVAAIARGRLAAFDNVRHVPGDALANKSQLSPALVDAVRAARVESAGPLKLVANLPYDIATALVIDLLLSELHVERLCFTVQSEVADRFLAEAGTRDYGPVSIITQLLCEGQRIAKAPPQAFWPAPKVSSTLVRLDRRPAEAVPVQDPAAFAAFVRPFFHFRRKTLANVCRQLGIDPAILGTAGIDHSLRPEVIPPDKWVRLYECADPA